MPRPGPGWLLVVAVGACHRPSTDEALLRAYPLRLHTRWIERTVTPDGTVHDEPMEERWERSPSLLPAWLVTTTTRPGSPAAKVRFARYELRGAGLVCTGASSFDAPRTITPPKLVLPWDPRPDTTWTADHTVAGRTQRRSCVLRAHDGCVAGRTLRCTVEDDSGKTVVESRYCGGVGIVGYEATTTRGALTWAVRSVDLRDG